MLKIFRSTTVWLLLICITSFFFTFFNQESVPACMNADEKAFGYNAYSLLKTGKDEYGTFMPLRLKSFGDYKLPLYSYLSVPFTQVFGLNEMGTQGINMLASFLLPLAVYFLTKEMMGKKSYGIAAALLVALSLSTHITARQAHESLINVLFMVAMFTFYLRSLRTNKVRDIILFLLFTALSLFSYHPARLLVLFLGASFFIKFIRGVKIERKKIAILGGLFTAVVILCLSVDLVYSPARIGNLLFFNNTGFTLQITEMRGEGAERLIYNKVTLGVKELVYQNAAYFSPQFLLSRGDENFRFGYPGMSVITLLEYLFLFVGLYYLFKNKASSRFFLLGLLLFAPLSGSLSWAGISLTRTLFVFVPMFIIIGYGFVEFIKNAPKKHTAGVVIALMALQLIGLFISWDFYLHHYTKRPLVIRSQECGYKELGDYIKQNYDKYKKFYITKEMGQPYMHLLYDLEYPPAKYQKQATLSAPDQYGFGQVEKFDKFIFNLPNEFDETGVVYIGLPWEITNRSGFNPDSDAKKLKKIVIGTQEIFSIFERD